VAFPKFEDVVKEYRIESSYVKVATSWDEQVIWLIDNVNVPDAHFSDGYDCSNSPKVFIHALSKPYVAEYLYINARDKENIISYCYDLIDFMDDVTRKNYIDFITKNLA
jgi:hypothetical protein